jgi:D-glycero-D-manno-heptose 1,7-bisphosphate phosphatase
MRGGGTLIESARMPQYLLLDRDGVINRRLRNGYVTSWPQFEFLPRVLEALRLLKANHYRALLISNQAAVGKKLMTMAQLSEITGRFLQHVQKSGGQIYGVYYCPHAEEDDCNCRKPRPGLLVKAQREHRFSFAETFLIGDSESDGLAAQLVGCPFIRLLNTETEKLNPCNQTPKAIFSSLFEAVNFLLTSREAGNRSAQLLTR